MDTAELSRIGAYGAKIVTNAVAQTGTWMAILCLSATVFATLTEPNGVVAGSIGSAVFPAGVTIYGAFTNFTLTSGSVRCYNTRNMVANP